MCQNTCQTCKKDDPTGFCWSEGLRLVGAGEVTVLVVLAGGQGTCLGVGAPLAKGMLELLFQLQAEQLLLVEDLASFVRTLNPSRRLDLLCMCLPF